jgi:hypothetical protein
VLEDPAYAKGDGWQAWYTASHPPVGNFCDTQQGRFGPGPAQIVGSPCTVNTGGGVINGQVVQ